MARIIDVDGHRASVSFDPEIGFLRGEFLGLSGGADFYAQDVEGLVTEARISLRAYLEMCAEYRIEPFEQHRDRR